MTQEVITTKKTVETMISFFVITNFFVNRESVRRIGYNVWRPCAGRISQTFAANRTEVQREDKDFEANAPLRQNGEADH
jgi:hypothetical protein